MANLILHCGASAVGVEEVKGVTTPDGTRTWHPLPHMDVYDAFTEELETSFDLKNTVHALNHDGGDWFCLMELHPKQVAQVETMKNLWVTTLGLRNSHLKRFRAGAVLGATVFVCDNLSFCGESEWHKKHTPGIRESMADGVKRLLEDVYNTRDKQEQRFEAYQNSAITVPHANNLIINAARHRVIPANKILEVADEFTNPRHEEFEEKNMWSLFNSFTEIMKPLGLETKQARTMRLHDVCDRYLGLAV